MSKKTKKITPRLDFLSPVSHIPGLGPKRCDALILSEIETIGDLLYYFPRKYHDRSKITPINRLNNYLDQECCIAAEITDSSVQSGKYSRLNIKVNDGTGELTATWFNGVQFLSKSLSIGKKILLCGKISEYNGIQMTHPTVEIEGKGSKDRIPFMPIYTITVAMKEAGLKGGQLFKSIKWVLDNLNHYPQILPDTLEAKRGFESLKKCLTEIHMPTNINGLYTYFNRLKYEELYQLALTLQFSKNKISKTGRSLDAGELYENIVDKLPFKLTETQKQAIVEIYESIGKPKRMYRLLQGDVGSGKTITAFLSTLPALNSGLQVAWLAPTEILAKQSFQSINQWLKPLGFSSVLLTGSVDRAQRAKIIRKIADGTVDFIVGTHSIIQSDIWYKAIGITVIDEQHKFGAKQRLTMQQKDPKSDILMMSATPIPKSVVETIYGELDVTTLTSLPDGRKSIKTHLVPEAKRIDMEGFIARIIQEEKGSIFWVVPRVTPNSDSSLDLKDTKSTLKYLKNSNLSKFNISAIHGKTPLDESNRIISDFTSSRIDILVSTTVIEVGIDMPKATVIIIENSERFGLSQLHQLRGRVGRGGQQAYAFLLYSDGQSQHTYNRLIEFSKINDGFKLADLDLTLRGPGEICGWKQSGFDELKIADIIENIDYFREIRSYLSTLTL